jgi:DNA damage-inducible protein 1
MNDPDMAAALESNDVAGLEDFLTNRLFELQKRNMARATEMAAMEADPFNMEYQRKIEAEIGNKNIQD